MPNRTYVQLSARSWRQKRKAVYREAAARLRTKPASVSPDALQRAAKLMRSFGEDYHEKQLEESNIFPALMKGGPFASTVNTLIAQHHAVAKSSSTFWR